MWDLPTRIFHWLLAALILFSWWSVKNDHTDWHIWSGVAILTALIFRLLWGVFGSSTARFAGFVRGPAAVRDDLSGRWTGIGHSPLGALSVIALLAAVAVQVGLGLVSQDKDGLYMGPLARLVSSDTSDQARDIHELWFNVVLGLIILHVAAIAVYRLRGRKLTLPMLTGKAVLTEGVAPMRPGKWWTALLCLIAAFAIARWVVAGAPPFGS
ncbi:cytochrome b/b6 domain-containing protein [Sphingomonas sp. URHD0057]|uniref:cytochrome b/b6 domain-containing protein n=1 Tax=Sphingomonas sp. URHD0057 TaxID=1380389 RepID=UPI0018CC1D8E|nr:cytochrome b/b6 domain-containing protein [Sphingomonas sp. URHD0057]